ncbi:hypothetical protein Nepgr_018308 [Nepenthes gracilis]|uniref:Uncharacterized protein n=1 Tax=Nepenthes gracilis TaxID=150966 RepID=A0AAD3XSY9_NEPGR|nr:hypothetical protein Nepgr_018308 [Nepenthes gracilis]
MSKHPKKRSGRERGKQGTFTLASPQWVTSTEYEHHRQSKQPSDLAGRHNSIYLTIKAVTRIFVPRAQEGGRLVIPSEEECPPQGEGLSSLSDSSLGGVPSLLGRNTLIKKRACPPKGGRRCPLGKKSLSSSWGTYLRGLAVIHLREKGSSMEEDLPSIPRRMVGYNFRSLASNAC